MRYYTPLRYPGGKASLSQYMRQVFVDNDLLDGAYVEPYAGGAAIGLELLMTGYVRDIWLNDIDPAIYAFWRAALDHSEDLIELVHTVPLTVDEWHRQRAIYLRRANRAKSPVKLGFATLFLNRTNRSGILHAGIIGGLAQDGPWLIDARFNRDTLAERLRRLAQHRNHVHVSCLDAELFLRQLALPDRTLVYIDPPYFDRGQRLYRNFYEPEDHEQLATLVQNELAYRWIVSYDDTKPIANLYKKRRKIRYSLQYSAQTKRQGGELLILCDAIRVPETRQPSKFRVN